MTITHVFGETTITERPQRVVTLGWYSQDVVAALGVVPVGVEDFTWGTVKEYLPWFKDKVAELGGELPELLRHDDAGAYDAASGAEEFVTSFSLEELGQVESQFHVGWGDVPDDVTRTLEHPLGAHRPGILLLLRRGSLAGLGVISPQRAVDPGDGRSDGGSAGHRFHEAVRAAGLLLAGIGLAAVCMLSLGVGARPCSSRSLPSSRWGRSSPFQPPRCSTPPRWGTTWDVAWGHVCH
ncbi:MAG: hypothetical protein Q4D89_01485 [Arachnia propionica]|uniref:hypothetical protein n=1 Tax=Arachnia propionica TaxID=1750 RepID=UPI0026F9E17F|nr:hypothetical protein [Arachnia propionica]